MEFRYILSNRGEVNKIVDKDSLLEELKDCKSGYSCMIQNKIKEFSHLTLVFLSTNLNDTLFKIIISAEKEKLNLIFKLFLKIKIKNHNTFPNFYCIDIDNIYEYINQLEDKLFNLIYKPKSANK